MNWPVLLDSRHLSFVNMAGLSQLTIHSLHSACGNTNMLYEKWQLWKITATRPLNNCHRPNRTWTFLHAKISKESLCHHLVWCKCNHAIWQYLSIVFCFLSDHTASKTGSCLWQLTIHVCVIHFPTTYRKIAFLPPNSFLWWHCQTPWRFV